MKTFKDNAGRSWDIIVDTTAIKRVRDLVPFDLLDVADGKLFARLADDPVLLVDVCFALVKPIADERKVTDEDFGRSMRGDAIGLAYQAVIQETIDFFPQALKREQMSLLIDKAQLLSKAMIERANHTLANLTINDLLATAAGSSSGNSPASSASIPAP